MRNIKLTVGIIISNIYMEADKFIYRPNGFRPFMVIQRDIVNRLDGVKTYKHRLTHGKHTFKYLG